MTQPNSSPQWKNPVTCPPGKGTGAASAYCSQGPFVFHLLKNQRVKHVGASSLDAVDLQWDMTLSDPRWCVPSMPASELSATCVTSQQFHKSIII